MLRSSVLVALAVVLSAVLTAAAPVAQVEDVTTVEAPRPVAWYNRKYMGVSAKRAAYVAGAGGAAYLAYRHYNNPSDPEVQMNRLGESEEVPKKGDAPTAGEDSTFDASEFTGA